MKVNETEKPDRYGTYPCCRVSGKDANPQNIHEWLYRNYEGYKFAIIFDCTKDEWEEPDKETPVYFLDTILDEVISYCGVDEVRKRLEKYEDEKSKVKITNIENMSRDNTLKRLYSYCNHRTCAECIFECSYCSFSLMSDVELKKAYKRLLESLIEIKLN